ncbi:TPA: helix-turn-helix domain-containing protein [Elizabethkingia anophelis]
MIQIYAEIFGVTEKEITSEKRTRLLSDVRKIISYRLRQDGLTLNEIGYVINRHHSAVINAIKQYKDLVNDPEFKTKIEHVNLEIKRRSTHCRQLTTKLITLKNQ